MTLRRAVTVTWLRQKTNRVDSRENWRRKVENGKYTQNFNEFCCNKEHRNGEQRKL